MKNKPVSQLRAGLGLTKYVLKATLRNRAGFFFSFVFPLAFVAAFGLFGNTRSAIRLGVSDRLASHAGLSRRLEQLAGRPDSPVDLVRGSDEVLSAMLARGEIAALVTRGDLRGGAPGRLALVTSTANPQAGTTLELILRGVLAGPESFRGGAEGPGAAGRLARREIAGAAHRLIDFILPGQIGFSMLSLATFGVGYTLSTLRRTLVLKRMLATAVRPITLVVAQGFSRSFQAVLQAAVILGVGVVAFHFHLAHGWLTLAEMLFLSWLGILAFLGFGILIANVARDDQSLPVALNLFNLPQMLLAGVFFSIDGTPPWVQAIGNNLPLAYLNISLRKAASEGAGLATLWPYILGMLAWGLAAYVMAARTFREE